MLEEVIPTYGNTHTTTSVTSLQTTLYRDESRAIIRNATNCSEHDAVIFTGNGVTGAVHKLIHSLNLDTPPIVFVSHIEHHSNLLPWREVAADIVRIGCTNEGAFDILDLEKKLSLCKTEDRPLIGAFSAASNITGLLTDVNLISSIIHNYGGLVFWDYATAGPYVEIDMNPVIAGISQQIAYKDAVFLSPHKFVGGPQTTGILLAKKSLFKNEVPSGCGGGSVFFVSRSGHRYLKDIENREEGGTPAILDSIRTGLVFQLKEYVGVKAIMDREDYIFKKAMDAWKDVNQLEILGRSNAPKLTVFSFVIRHPTGLYLHHNFVCSLLNDLFGIQARGGCACAGPYAQDLLGISEDLALKYENTLLEDTRLDRTHLRRMEEHSENEVLRPGFSRLNLPYFMSEEDIDFVLEAVRMVAENGWKLLPQYKVNNETGEWRHHSNHIMQDRKWLSWIDYSNSQMAYKKIATLREDNTPVDTDPIQTAHEVLSRAKMECCKLFVPDQTCLFDADTEPLRWFLLPCEAKSLLCDDVPKVKQTVPFLIRRYKSETLAPNCVTSLTENIDLDKSQRINRLKGEVRSSISESLAKHNSLHDGESLNIDVIRDILKDKTVDNYINRYLMHTSSDITGKILHVLNELVDLASSPTKCLLNSDSPKTPECITAPAIIPPIAGGWKCPHKNLWKPFAEAVSEFGMIKNGDVVLVCLSGGKDSLTLLHLIRQYQFYAKSEGISFTFGAVTVNPMSDAYDPSPLIPYLASLKVPYFFESQDIIGKAESLEECTSICSFCSRMKRGRIYSTARREGYNVVALGQHLDDLAESFFMSLFHNGSLRTMKAHYHVKEKDLRVIRPLVYVREKDTRKFAESNKLPVIPENCPACFEAPKERHRMKQLLAQQEIKFPRLFFSLAQALHPLMSLSRTEFREELKSKLLDKSTQNCDSDGED